MGFKSLIAQALNSLMAASESYKRRSHDGLPQMLQMNNFYELSFRRYNPLECMHTFKMSAEALSRSLDLCCKKTIHVFPIQFSLVHSALGAQNGKRRNKEDHLFCVADAWGVHVLFTEGFLQILTLPKSNLVFLL